MNTPSLKQTGIHGSPGDAPIDGRGDAARDGGSCPHCRPFATLSKLISLISLALVTCCLLSHPQPAAAVGGKVVREGVELLLRKFGTKAAAEGGEALTDQLTRFVSRHGQDGVEAASRVGPAAVRYADQAGEAAPRAVKFMARRGNEAVWVVGNEKRLAIFIKYGDDAGDAMVKHRGLADSLIEAYGTPAARALNAVDPRNARRLAMLDESRDLARIGRTDELMQVIERYGDRAAEFVWRNKGALLVGASLTAFLSDPEPFLAGTRRLAETATTAVAQPIAEQVGRQTNWTAVVLTALAAVVLLTTWTGRHVLRLVRWVPGERSPKAEKRWQRA